MSSLQSSQLSFLSSSRTFSPKAPKEQESQHFRVKEKGMDISMLSKPPNKVKRVNFLSK
jgi:hypothetical protein